MIKSGYKCDKCGLDVPVEVRERYPNEDVVNYVHHVGNVCGRDHSIRSPYCTAKVLTYIKIPITQSGIGFDGPELTKEDLDDLKAKGY